MPIYAYKCKDCGHSEDISRRISEAIPQLPCPKCHEQQSFEKQLSAPSFQLKGNGWYATDFKGN